MVRLVALSSTISTGSLVNWPGSAGAVGRWASGPAAAAEKGSVKWNRLPSASLLSAHSRPPISETNWRQIDSPRPVPPYFRVVDESAWVKLSKMLSNRSAGIPTPVSRTTKCKFSAAGRPPGRETWPLRGRETWPLRGRETWPLRGRETLTTISPCSVNLIALPMRLTRT